MRHTKTCSVDFRKTLNNTKIGNLKWAMFNHTNIVESYTKEMDWEAEKQVSSPV